MIFSYFFKRIKNERIVSTFTEMSFLNVVEQVLETEIALKKVFTQSCETIRFFIPAPEMEAWKGK